MEEESTLTRRSFVKGAAGGLGLIQRNHRTTGDRRAAGNWTCHHVLAHFTKNVPEFEMKNPLVGFPLQILWPDRIHTSSEFYPYDIYVGNSAFSPLRDLSNITRRIESGNFTVFEGEFQEADVQKLLEEQYYNSYEEIGKFTLMSLRAKVIGFTDNVALEGDYTFTRANLKRIKETIHNRRQDEGVPETAPEFEAVTSKLDTSYLTTAKFNISIDDTVPQLGSLTDSI